MHFVKNLSAVGVTASFSLFFASGKTFFYTSEIYLFYTRLSFQLYFHIYVVTAGLKISEHLDTIVFFFCEVANCKKKQQEKHWLVSLFVRRHRRLDFVFGYLKVFHLISKMHPKWWFFFFILMKGERSSGNQEQNPFARNSPHQESVTQRDWEPSLTLNLEVSCFLTTL